jgi:rubrerythrin
VEFTTIDDILEFAMEKEDASYRLYKSAATASHSSSAKKLFEEMAEQEAAHKRFIQQLDKKKIAEFKIGNVPDQHQRLRSMSVSRDTFQKYWYAMKCEESIQTLCGMKR